MLLNYGSSGSDVSSLQQKLNENGYSLPVTGYYGNQTQAAVRDYQTKNGLSIDGIAGDQTWGKLTTAKTAAASSEPAAALKAPTYQYDASGDKAYQAALQELQSAKGSGAPQYQAQYDTQLNDIYQKIMNREKFSYDLNGDLLYNQYKNQYTDLGKTAMQDTMGQAAALTGGYDSTYAQSAGQQQYDAYLQKLNEVIPELYQNARDAYDQEGTNLQSQYALTADLRDDDYSRYQDQLTQYWNNVDRQTNVADTLYNRGYEEWNTAQDTAYERQQDAYDKAVQQLTTLGYMPSDQELVNAGMSKDEAAKWLAYYQAQSYSSSGGSGSGSGSVKSSGSGSGGYSDSASPVTGRTGQNIDVLSKSGSSNDGTPATTDTMLQANYGAKLVLNKMGSNGKLDSRSLDSFLASKNYTSDMRAKIKGVLQNTYGWTYSRG